MPEFQLLEQIKNTVQLELASAEASHDWQHILRVEQNALQLLEASPKANPLVVLLGVYLHDIADAKFHEGNEAIGPQKTFDLLTKHRFPSPIIDEVVFIVKHMSFRTSFKKIEKNLNFQLVQDADRLDAIGAIGIARAFQYGGFKNRKLYSNLPPKAIHSKEDYKKSEAATLQHFFEKLLNLKNLMNTPAGKAEAEKRHNFMCLYLEEFYRETQQPKWLKKLLQ
ncbi:MAG: HD domain-containing protein [Flavobacteriaceae bacterium]|nr:HD domain-containing protein [Flavobacteriaceae bacterium]